MIEPSVAVVSLWATFAIAGRVFWRERGETIRALEAIRATIGSADEFAITRTIRLSSGYGWVAEGILAVACAIGTHSALVGEWVLAGGASSVGLLVATWAGILGPRMCLLAVQRGYLLQDPERGWNEQIRWWRDLDRNMPWLSVLANTVVLGFVALLCGALGIVMLRSGILIAASFTLGVGLSALVYLGTVILLFTLRRRGREVTTPLRTLAGIVGTAFRRDR